MTSRHAKKWSQKEGIEARGKLEMPGMERASWELQMPRKIGWFCSLSFKKQMRSLKEKTITPSHGRFPRVLGSNTWRPLRSGEWGGTSMPEGRPPSTGNDHSSNKKQTVE